MTFAAPIWLWGLIPWAGVVVWMFTGQRPRADVPFLELWRGPVHGPRAKRTFDLPPLAIVLALLAILFGIIAAAAPAIRLGIQQLPPITIILDRGISMAAHGQAGARWRELVGLSSRELAGFGPVDLISIPGETDWTTDRSDWMSVTSEPSSSMKTLESVRSAIGSALARNDDPLIVLTDQKLVNASPRIIQIAPTTAPSNVGIVSLAARSSPTPQVMVRVRNQSAMEKASLTVRSGDATVTNPIDLPAPESEQNYFVDLPRLGDDIEVSLEAPDDLQVDNHAWLVRERVAPRIEARIAIAEELARMIDVYRKNRASAESSKIVAVARDLAPNENGVVIPPPAEADGPVTGDLQIAAHPVTESVHWTDVLRDATVRAHPPTDDWKPLVSSGSKVLVAARDGPARQIWIGFDSPAFPRTADFVILWTNIFDWLGQGAEEFASAPMSQLGREWQLQQSAHLLGVDELSPAPGIYARNDGARRALNAIDVRFDDPPASDWRQKLASISPATASAGRPISRAFCMAAIALILLSTIALKARKPVRASGF